MRIQAQTVGAAAQLAILAMLWAGVGLGLLGWLAGIAYAGVTWALLTSALRRFRTNALSLPDRITLARAVLAGGVTAIVTDRLAMDHLMAERLVTGRLVTDGAAGDLATGRLMADHPGATAPLVVLIALAAVALLLDAVDGQVARRTGTTSPLGARFDMEVDAFLILVLSVHVASSLGGWVLALGAMRYVFAAAAWAAPWLAAPLPPSLARKAVAALQGVALVVAGSGLLPTPAAITVVGIALALLTWSFARDTGRLSRTARPPRPLSTAALPGRPGAGNVMTGSPAGRPARTAD